MLGHSHALSGAVTGLAVGIATHMTVAHTAALGGLTAGMALLPDLDACGSSPARSLGFLSEAVSHLVRRLSGGHRHVTHSVAGIAAFTALAWLAVHFRADWAGKAGLALLVALSVASALEALRLARSHVADLVGIVVAVAEAYFGFGLNLIVVAVLTGCATHVAGDMLTDSGCMLAYPASRRRIRLLPEPLAFTTGTRPELVFVDPVLTIALVLLAAWAADPAFVAAHWHALTS